MKVGVYLIKKAPENNPAILLGALRALLEDQDPFVQELLPLVAAQNTNARADIIFDSSSPRARLALAYRYPAVLAWANQMGYRRLRARIGGESNKKATSRYRIRDQRL